jgi:acetyl esterase
VIAACQRALRIAATASLLAAVSAPLAVSSASAASTYPLRVHQNVVYGKSTQGTPLTADIYSPASDAGPSPMVVMIHGGGFNSGDKQGDTPYAESMASIGFVVVNVNYTLATPTLAGYPEQVQEMQSALRWSIAHARQYQGNPAKVSLVGFSAGGYLATMAGLLDANLPGRPVKAVVTLSAPLDFPALDQLLRARVAACGYRTSCAQMPQAQLSAFGTLFEFLGCPKGKCSPQLIQQASPTTHVTPNAPDFLIFNSADELIPRSQATAMGTALKAAGVPESVVIVPGTQHGEAYLPSVSPAILNYLDRQVGLPQSGVPASPAPTRSSGPVTVLVVGCAVVLAASLVMVVLAARRRMGSPLRQRTESH